MDAILVNLGFYITIDFLQLTVANTKSAIKRVKIAERNRLRNKSLQISGQDADEKIFRRCRDVC